MSNYSDIQKAVRVEKFRIWFAWFCGGFVALGVTNATAGVEAWGMVAQVVFLTLGVLFTIAAVRMTNALNRKAEAARIEVLGDL